ncbi:gliding motility lipoprotein GldH [Pedobacter deserti]|uniref:gliding motility lipoprotein GldH n=1 Tax=Pedobacter deserti TaxID=2817382 RepID=UPI00210DDD7E|nr:gliding motility lipoprotein GldH [Pedobacter sp. SYSU D00382]
MSRPGLLVVAALLCLFFYGCEPGTIADTNVSVPARNWTYVNKARTVVDIQDISKAYNIYFKLRHTSDYRYSNIFILMHMGGAGIKKHTHRYEYRLAEPDGRWLGAGSGNLYTYTFPLLTNYRFTKPGKYAIEIEQNMRDNPLKEISDVGIKVSQQGQ